MSRAFKGKLIVGLLLSFVVAGGWAVWHHGYVARLTRDINIVLPKDRIDEFLRLASVTGFEVMPLPEGRWPKLRHKDMDIDVDLLPEGAARDARQAGADDDRPSEHAWRRGGRPSVYQPARSDRA